MRRIELGESLSTPGTTTIEIDVSSVALEVQRSLDYYESHYDRSPSEIVAAIEPLLIVCVGGFH